MSAENRGTGQLSCNWVLGIQKGYRTLQNCPVPLFSCFTPSRKISKFLVFGMELSQETFQNQTSTLQNQGTGQLSCKLENCKTKGTGHRPPRMNSQISSLTSLKNLKSQISNLKSSIVNPQTSNLKISNPKSLGWAA